VRALLGNWLNGDGLFVVCDNFAYADLLNTSSTTITNKMQYDGGADSALFNYEMGSLADIRIVVSPFAKAFYAAGAANAAPVATTLNGAVNAGAKTITVSANTNISAGMWLTIGTAQTTTESDTTLITEVVKVSSIAATVITVVGAGSGGTLMYDHATLVAVSNADTVHSCVFGTADSLAVKFDGFGRYGKLVHPPLDGNAQQWETWSFKYFGGYKCFDQSKLERVEVSASKQ